MNIVERYVCDVCGSFDFDWNRMKEHRKTHESEQLAKQEAPTGTQTRSLGWTGYQLTVKELRGWLAPLPDHATLEIWGRDPGGRIEAKWEVTP